MYKEIKNHLFIQLVFFMKPSFRYLDIVYATGSTSFKYLFTSVSRLVCGKRYRGKHLIYSQALNCISCSTVFAAMQVYYCMITLIIFFSFSQQICKELDLFDVYYKCHTDKTQEHACLFYWIQHDNRILM